MKANALTFLLLLPLSLMGQQKNTVTEELLRSFAEAFNAHDVKTIMSMMTDDCVFEASAGPDVNGEKFTGQDQVEKAFENVFATFPNAKWNNPRHFISGDRGVSVLRASHAVWVMRHAASLEGTSREAGGGALHPARAEAMHRVAARISAAVERSGTLDLDPSDRGVLLAEADELARRAALELGQSAKRDLASAEQWIVMARAFREILDAADAAP